MSVWTILNSCKSGYSYKWIWFSTISQILFILTFLGFLIAVSLIWAYFDSIVDAIIKENPNTTLKDAELAVKYLLILLGVGGISKFISWLWHLYPVLPFTFVCFRFSMYLVMSKQNYIYVCICTRWIITIYPSPLGQNWGTQRGHVIHHIEA